MDLDARINAKFLVRKLLLSGDSELLAHHPWISEVDRWKELVFALLTRATDLSQPVVREIANKLMHLQLLDISDLAKLLHGDPPVLDVTARGSQHILQILREGGFTPEAAQVGLKALIETAAVFKEHFAGKVQFYLRGYAETMVKEAEQIFRGSVLSSDDVRYAVTLWLQNVMNLPLPLPDPAIERYSEVYGLSAGQVFDAADELDVNVALIDDLIKIHTPLPITEPAEVAAVTPRKYKIGHRPSAPPQIKKGHPKIVPPKTITESFRHLRRSDP